MMPGTFRFSGGSEDVSKPQPPPVAPRVTVQSWQPTPVAPLDGSLNMYGNHVRSGSVDSLDSSSGSSVSSSSSGGSHTRQHSGDSGEFIPTRTLNKNPSVPAYNPLQFVKVQSPLYRKAEQQIKLAKEVKIARETLKEGEEEWQSNLDNWKSRRRKASERVFQRAEEMRQIEAEEQQRQHQQQQRKIKTFSEIVEKRSQKKHNYNFDLYMGQGDDSGLGATPEPEDQDSSLDNINSTARSDVSEDVTSESESVDSDARCSDKNVDLSFKTTEKEPPEVPKKPYSWLSRKNQSTEPFKMNSSSEEILNSSLQHKEIFHVDNLSSAEPSDIECHAGDIETLSSEDDAGYCGPVRNVDSGLDSLNDCHHACDVADSASDFSQGSCTGLDKANRDTGTDIAATDGSDAKQDRKDAKVDGSEETIKGEGHEMCMKLFLKQNGDSKGFGFSLKGGKDQSSKAYVDSISPGGAAEAAGLLVGDLILCINGEKTASNSHSSLVFAVKQAVYVGQLDLVIWRLTNNGTMTNEIKMKDGKDTVLKKGSSFAEKIAMFSNGVSSHTSQSPPPVAPRSSVPLSKVAKSEEPKKESLVLRRKSAFECSPAGDQVKKRWSSCVSSENSVSSKLTNDERRHSVDFTKPVDKTAYINSSSKKALPPPVPVKPKVKPRVQNSEHHAPYEEMNRNKVDVPVDQSVSGRHEMNIEDENRDLLSFCKHDSVSVPNEQENGVSQCTLSAHLHEQSVNADVLNSHSETEKTPLVPDQVANNIEGFSGLEESSLPEGNIVENILPNIPESPACKSEAQHFENSNSLSFMHSSDIQVTDAVISPEDGLLNSTDSVKISLEDELIPSTTQHISNTDTQVSEEVNSILVIDEPSYLPKNEHLYPGENGEDNSCNQTAYTGNLTDQVLNLEEEYDDSRVDSVKISENTVVAEDSGVQQRDFECRPDNPVVVDPDTNSDGRECHFEINVPPLCLTLEKIDEDDVVSASTTTSSETPDTETVIEHFPSNVSPLPNDDIISENLNSEPRDSSFDLTAHSVTASASENSILPTDNSIPEGISETNNETVAVLASENEVVTEHKHVESFIVEVESTNHFRETFSRSQDDDIPLTEDVIDEIEMRLMQQLEQQGELEDMSEDQDGPLEDEVNRQLMYLSDDADLLEDLDAPPRHAVPPSEPPPPPPPPEMEGEENKTPPLMRVNSTKRIKKEISRRRSDFLGLGSGEGIDIDNIPPRPSGLEELYKSEMQIEREQRLWLEKRLSLAEPLPDEMESFDVPSSVISNAECTYYPNNMPEVLDAEVYDAVANEFTRTDKQDLQEVCPAEEHNFLTQSPEESLEKVIPDNPADNEVTSPGESPQHKAKQHIQSLGAAPRAKIMDSDKWITQAEKNPASKRRSVDPVLQESRGTQNFWLAREAEKKNSLQRTNPQPHNVVDRRYSMPPAYGGSRQHPDVTVRTWGDRELSFQQRPKSAIWDASSRSAAYDPYLESCYSSYSGASRVPLSHSQYETQAYSQRHPIDLRRCSYCREELTDGSAMGIEALQLYFHIECFHCCVCGLQLGNGLHGTDVQVKNNQLYCPSCFTLD